MTQLSLKGSLEYLGSTTCTCVLFGAAGNKGDKVNLEGLGSKCDGIALHEIPQ